MQVLCAETHSKAHLQACSISNISGVTHVPQNEPPLKSHSVITINTKRDRAHEVLWLFYSAYWILNPG